MDTSLVWFRDDLRVADNPALTEACARGGVLAVYVLDEESEGVRPHGSASRWWLHHSLESLREGLDRLGIELLLRRGPAAVVLPELIRESDSGAVFWNRRYGGPERAVDAAVKQWCGENGVSAQSFQANLLHEPWTLQTKTGGPYKVFTPFWKACAAIAPRDPLPAPARNGADRRVAGAPSSEALDEWELLPARPDWAGGLRDTWTPGEAGAAGRLEEFFDERLDGYDEGREQPALEGTSRLSPHLKFGEISPFQVWAAISGRRRSDPSADLEVFAAEVGWREFCWHLLYHWPELATANFRPQFDAFPWADSAEPQTAARIDAWRRGSTGFPLVDAGMRQLWETGWMHNRVRMVTASLLTKNLRVDWRVGEAWFWDTLVDADAANNPANWQWVAGSGADASPYFRVFNPVTQSRKFDPEGTYLRRWLPELAGLDARAVHEPWRAAVEGYPEPIVDLAESRREALEAYDVVRSPLR